MKFEVKALKTWNTREGGGYQCTIWMDGKRAFFVHNDGNGGQLDFETRGGQGDDGLLAAFEAFVEDLPRETWIDEDGDPFEPGRHAGNVNEEYLRQQETRSKMEMYVARLIDQHEENKRLKRLCSKKTVLRLKDDPGHYRVYDVAFNPQVEAKLRAKLGEQVAEVVNLRFV